MENNNENHATEKQINPLKKNNKCKYCKKKCVISITCNKCENVFCIKHRCPENHDCLYDHKKDIQVSEKIIPPKIEVI